MTDGIGNFLFVSLSKWHFASVTHRNMGMYKSRQKITAGFQIRSENEGWNNADEIIIIMIIESTTTTITIRFLRALRTGECQQC